MTKNWVRRGVAMAISVAVMAGLLAVTESTASAATPPAGSAGALDSGFGTGGVTSTSDPTLTLTAASKVLVQPDGKIVVAGIQPGSAGNVVVTRFTATGAKDTTFGAPLGYTKPGLGSASSQDGVQIALQPDGKILVAGSKVVSSQARIALARLNSNGSLDTTFASGGTATLAFGSSMPQQHGSGVLVLPSGQILMSIWIGPGHDAFKVVRYSSTGVFDTSFGSSGLAISRPITGQPAQAADLALTSDNKIVVVGSVNTTHNSIAQTDTAVVRFTASGQPDTTFPAPSGNSQGAAILDRNSSKNDAANAVLIDASGRINLSGTIASTPSAAYVMRLTSTGVADSTFGTGGVLQGTFGGAAATGGGAAFDANGRLLVAGGDGASTTNALGIERLLSSGATPYDGTFGLTSTPGRESVVCSPANSGAGYSVAVQPDQRIVLAGVCNGAITVARLNVGNLSNLTMTTSTPNAPAGHGTIPLSSVPGGALLSTTNSLMSSPGFGTPGFGTPGFGSPGFGSPGFGTPGFGTPGFGTPGFGTPGFGTPVDQSPLTDPFLGPIPLSAIAISPSALDPTAPSTWDQVLAGTVYAGLPTQSITIQQLFALNPVPAALHKVTIGQLDVSATGLRKASVGAYLLGRTPTSALPAPAGGFCNYLTGQPANCSNTNVATASLLGLELQGDSFQSYFSSTPINLVGLALTGSPLSTTLLNNIDVAQTTLGAVRATALTTPSTFLKCTPSSTAGPCYTLADALASGNIQTTAGATLGALLANSPSAVGQLYLSNLLLGLMSRQSLPIENLAATTDIVANSPLPTSGAAYTIGFDMGCGAASSLVVTPALPAGFRLIPSTVNMTVGSSSVNTTVGADGTIRPSGSFSCSQTQHVTVNLQAEPSSVLGGPVTAGTTVAVSTDSLSLSNQAPVTTVDNFEPDDVTAGNPGNSKPFGSLYLGHISGPGDIDYFVLQPPPSGSTVTVTLSNLPIDADLMMYGAASPLLRASPGFGTPGFGTPGFGSPGFGTPGFGSPGFGSPGFGSPGFGTPGFGSPGFGSDAADKATPPQLTDDVPRLNLPVRGFSAQRNLVGESITTKVTDADTSPLLIQVSGYNGASSPQPYTLRISATPAPGAIPCQARSFPTRGTAGTLPSTPLPGNTQTLILTNQKRLGDVYGNVALPGGFNGDAGVGMTARLQSLAGQSYVNGVVVPVEGDAAVANAYAAWDASPCNVALANDVVAKVNALVDRLRSGLNDLRYIVIAGSDEIIPMGRVPDKTAFYNEAGFSAGIFGGADNAQSSAAKKGFILSDNPFGDFAPTAMLDTQLFVPQIAVGRLVETPAEMAASVDGCVTAGCRTTPSASFVTGYAPMDKGAQEINSILAQRGVATSSQINNTWTRNDAKNGLASAANGYGAINAHYDYSRALPAQEFTNGTESDPLSTADLPSSLAGGVQWTIGCHSGLNIPDIYIASPTQAEQAKTLDWSQAMLHNGAAGFVGQTGYGLGDTDALAYSERLSVAFAKNLDGTMTIGQALAFAKQQFLATGAPSVYDVKSVQEATFYGLPMWRIGPSGTSAQATLPPPPPSPPSTVTLASTSKQFDSAVTPFSNPPRTSNNGRGQYYTVGNEAPQVTPNQPIEPRTEIQLDPRSDGLVAHGAVIETLSSQDTPGFNPIYATAIADVGTFNPEPKVSTAYFPSALQSVSGIVTPNGRRDSVVLVPGQFFSDGSGTGTGTQRLYTKVGLTVLSSNSLDSTAPRIATVNGGIQGITASFTVTTPATDVQRAVFLVLVNPSQGWKHVEAVNAGGGKWVGTMTVPSGTPSIGQYFVQLADTSGNVGIDSNKGQDWSAGGIPGFSFSANPGADPNTGLYPDGTTVSITPPTGVSFTYSLDGGPNQSYTGPITITGDKGHTLTATASNGVTASLGIPIDAHDPTATITSPANGGNYNRGQVVTPAYSCSSAVTIRSCTGPTTVDTSSPGSKTYTVTATDVFGRTGTGSSTYNVVNRVPAIVFTTKPSNPTHPADPAYGKFVYALSDPDDPVSSLSVTCKLDGASVPCGNDLATVTPAPRSASHTFVATVTDPFGGTGSASYTWNVYFDTVLTANGVVASIPRFDADLKTTGGASVGAGKTVHFFAGQNQNPSDGTGALCSAVTDASGHATCGDAATTLAALGAGGITVVFFGTVDYWKAAPKNAAVVG
ncbi:MAG: large repetitive protein [Acidimicrobiaceae bacterium]|jgi:uncharacterized delta-60 repeat protein